MKSRNISHTDLRLLRDFFAPACSLFLHDAFGRINGNIPENLQDFDPDQQAAVLVETHPDYFVLTRGTVHSEDLVWFDYINNPDGTIRWFYPSSAERPYYLALYNATSFKAKVYRFIAQVIFHFKGARFLASGRFGVENSLVQSAKQTFGIGEEERCTFFTGTRGATRKMVVEAGYGKDRSEFIKIPFSPKASELIQNECTMVRSLSKYDFSTLSLPKISGQINGHARLTGVKPAAAIPADRITSIHVRALTELYALSHENRTVADSDAWVTLQTNMEYLSRELTFTNTLNREKTLHLIGLMRELYSRIPLTETVPVSVSHGDFTPWNMYCDEYRLYVYDWEMAGNGIPMLFDLFHFSYQSTILQKRQQYPAVKSTIQSWKQLPAVQKLVRNYGINTELHHALYLLFNVSHYVRQYLSEDELLEQSHWMIDAWTEALQDTLALFSKKSRSV